MPHPMPTDPEVLAYIARSDAFYPPDAVNFSLAEQRGWYDKYALVMRAPLPEGVTFADIAVPAQNPARKIPARRYQPPQTEQADTVILYLHGGGYILGGLESHHDVCAELCARTGLPLVSPDYRLAPEHIHPAQVEDTQVGYAFLTAQYGRVIVGGDSAGAGLAMALALRCKARGLPVQLGQFLIYGGFGGDMTRGSFIENADAPMLTTADLMYYYKMRTGGRDRSAEFDPDLKPLLAPDFSGLPPSAIVSADIDPLRDDSRELAEKLRAAGVPAVWRNEPQLVHGYLRARNMSRRAAESFAWIVEAVRDMAAGEFNAKHPAPAA